jgi:hypothetical protein
LKRSAGVLSHRLAVRPAAKRATFRIPESFIAKYNLFIFSLLAGTSGVMPPRSGKLVELLGLFLS